ncbi:hypothetical protein [Melittangium boletus]|uniref:Uncharacterized protein n=1 Tax=Melittangium boletus DSM 14713 TaxID=1294270 RepID=A0A286NV02_9BACT|nr:hypothetical protein [Melittangium boletus]ATB26869.1 hypothetical protein MEBOL_000303 [Melittangium boletus DSM 14713]
MSRINGLPGPRLPTVAPSSTRGVSSTSFLSRVQANASGVVSLPPSAPASGVSGRAVISSAIASARQEAAAQAPAASSAPPDAAQQQKQAVEEMSRSFLMGTMQSIFQGIGEAGPKAPQDD